MKVRRAMNICTGEVLEYRGPRARFKRLAKLLSCSDWRGWYTNCGYSKRPCQIVFKAVKKGF